MRGGGKVAEVALPWLYALGPGLDHVGVTPHRQQAPTVDAGREEIPVAEGIAKGRVGYVVDGQGEAIEGKDDLAVLSLRCRARVDMHVLEPRTTHEQADQGGGGHGLDLERGQILA